MRREPQSLFHGILEGPYPREELAGTGLGFLVCLRGRLVAGDAGKDFTRDAGHLFLQGFQVFLACVDGSPGDFHPFQVCAITIRQQHGVRPEGHLAVGIFVEPLPEKHGDAGLVKNVPLVAGTLPVGDVEPCEILEGWRCTHETHAARVERDQRDFGHRHGSGGFRLDVPGVILLHVDRHASRFQDSHPLDFLDPEKAIGLFRGFQIAELGEAMDAVQEFHAEAEPGGKRHMHPVGAHPVGALVFEGKAPLPEFRSQCGGVGVIHEDRANAIHQCLTEGVSQERIQIAPGLVDVFGQGLNLRRNIFPKHDGFTKGASHHRTDGLLEGGEEHRTLHAGGIGLVRFHGLLREVLQALPHDFGSAHHVIADLGRGLHGPNGGGNDAGIECGFHHSPRRRPQAGTPSGSMQPFSFMAVSMRTRRVWWSSWPAVSRSMAAWSASNRSTTMERRRPPIMGRKIAQAAPIMAIRTVAMVRAISAQFT